MQGWHEQHRVQASERGGWLACNGRGNAAAREVSSLTGKGLVSAGTLARPLLIPSPTATA